MGVFLLQQYYTIADWHFTKGFYSEFIGGNTMMTKIMTITLFAIIAAFVVVVTPVFGQTNTPTLDQLLISDAHLKRAGL